MEKDMGLYVHVPFCLKKCGYCDFLSFCADSEEKEKYASHLLSEIKSFGSLSEEYTFSTVYIGGGTPTALKSLPEIITEIRKSFKILPDAEFTVEANPETVTFSLMKDLYNLGVNRISMGVQALNDETLQKIGRIHDVNKVLESFAAIRLAGFKNVNYDLIFALPDQSRDEFLTGLKDLLKLSPRHVSLYSLMLEKGTPLEKNKDKFHFVSEDEEREIYYEARRILKENGLFQYEISNFSVPDYESRHNLRYWNAKEYIGLGLGASGYFKGARYQNPNDLVAYYKYTENFSPLYLNEKPLSKEEKMSEFVFLGLRKTCGISINTFEKRFGINIFEKYEKQIEKHINSGLLREENGLLRLTEKGMDLSNTVLCDFV